MYMMMAIAIMATISCQSKSIPSKSYAQETVDSKGNKMLLGRCTRESLQGSPFDQWFNKNYNDYKIDSITCEALKSQLPAYHITIFMGTWCGDSRREVPRMMKILDYCGVSSSQVKFIMLNSLGDFYKQSPGHEEKGLEIHRVPDFILYKGKKETGRIIEEPVVSLEKDLLSIINEDGYTPNYKAVAVLGDLLKKNASPYSDAQLLEFANTTKPYSKSSNELNTYGYVKMAAGEMDKAEAAFRINIKLYPNDPNLYDSMGDFYVKTNKPSLAKENYQKRLELEPSNEDTRKKLMQLQNN